MTSVVDLIELTELARLATPANIRLGQQIVNQSGVELEAMGPERVLAKVGGVKAADQRRTVELAAGPSGLQ